MARPELPLWAPSYPGADLLHLPAAAYSSPTAQGEVALNVLSFRDSRNLDIWVITALEFIAMHRRGAGIRELDEELQRLRAVADAPPPDS